MLARKWNATGKRDALNTGAECRGHYARTRDRPTGAVPYGDNTVVSSTLRKPRQDDASRS